MAYPHLLMLGWSLWRSRRVNRSLKRVGFLAFLMLALVAAAGGLEFYLHMCASLPLLDGTAHVAGLEGRVEVRRDARAVPHVRAQSLSDVLFAQGYVTAQDRLWQMDLNRRHAQGRLSEVFGERTLQMDKEARTLGSPRLAEQTLANLDSQTRGYLTSYARGVNAFIASHRARLPLEFWLLRYEPEPWREVDSIAVALNLSVALSQSWEDDLMRERVMARLGRDLSSDVFPDHSAMDIPVAEAPHSGKAKLEIRNSKFEKQHQGRFSNFEFRISGFAPGGGSNNWVLSGAHTKSGRPLLESDPHLGHSIPSIWYMVHLKAPGLNVSGVSLPGLPWVVIGHNEHVAWGMTNTGPDVQDLYSETFSPTNPGEYLHNGHWLGAEVRDEIIKVRGANDYHLAVKVTRHGPIVSHEGERDLALRWTALEPYAIRLPLLRIDQARNWQEFTQALRDFTVPMQNFVYADVEGNIGFYAAGLVPIRRRGDGTVPVPGSTDDFDWVGYVPFEDLPHAYNPPSGMVATANGRIVPEPYPYLITRKWDAPFRTARIYQLLRSGNSSVPSDMLRIACDILSLEDQWLARQLLAASAHRLPEGSDTIYALSVLKSWDGEARADSAATLVCEVTRAALLERILKPKLGEDLSGYYWPMRTIFLQNVLEQNLTRWLPPGDADFDVTLMKSLEEGVRRIPSLVHSQNYSAWRWGDTIPLTFHHPLSSGIPLLGRLLDVGPFPQAGTGTTVKQTTTRLGPSMRMVVDFSDFDRSMQNITLGQSGQPFSPYYREEFEAWYTGRSYPMLFTDAAVEKGAVHTLILEPAR